VSIGESLRGLSGKDVQFVTAPSQPDPANPATVQFAQPQADELFSAIARDVSVSKAAAAASGAGKGKTAGQASGVSPSQVKVKVLNGNGMSGIAAVAAGELSSRGFMIAGTGDAPTFGYVTSVIEYGSVASLPAAQELKTQLSAARLQQTAGLPPGQVTLVLGNDFTDLAPQAAAQQTASPQAASAGRLSAGPTATPTGPAAATSSGTPSTSLGSPSASASGSASASPSASAGGSGVSSAAAANGGITAAASCGSDAGAFQGPLSP
jgi:hypothetical protein